MAERTQHGWEPSGRAPARTNGGGAPATDLGDLLDALAGVGGHPPPDEIARRVSQALGDAFGWRAEVVPGSTLSTPPGPQGYELVDGGALVAIAPGAGALRIRPVPGGADAARLPAVAALAARAFWSAQSGAHELAEANRRLRESLLRRDTMLATATSELRGAAEILLGAAPPPDVRADEARRLFQIADDLERATRPGSPETRPAPRPRRTAGQRPRLLVVDDDADVRESLKLLLEDEYEVLLAEDGEAGLEVANAEHPDVVLMDIVMPRLDGFEALERLRSDASTGDIPVIFVSGRGDDAIKVRSLDLGAVDFLQKPFSERELRARVERTLRLVRSQTQLRELAQTDPLTGLANLRAFRARVEEEVKRARRYRTPLTCVMADMDNLKPINDELGHAAGDRAIAAVAAVIRDELRETDFGARYGGDEFVVLLPHTTAEEGRIFAERVCTRLKETLVELGGRRIPLGASFGVACLCDEGPEDAEEALVRDADAALYAAKRAGRGRVAVAPVEELELRA
ncbi:MAG TPA: diguanylate cyclase [Anaeromyxobacteraceae bacterium]|nr:diguanylate cyclase [Anaeromyxobacteraceae bacterium]